MDGAAPHTAHRHDVMIATPHSSAWQGRAPSTLTGMGMIEEARVSLAKGRDGDSDALLAASAQANIAVAESLHDVTELLNALLEKLDRLTPRP